MKSKFLKTAILSLSILGIINAYSQTNIALNKPVTVSSTFAEEEQYDAKNAVDGKENSRWMSKPSYSQWLYIDLGSSNDIHQIAVKWAKGRSRSYALRFEVQTSDDAKTWTTIQTVESNDKTENFFDKLSAKARYVKINGLGRSGQSGYAIRELEIF